MAYPIMLRRQLDVGEVVPRVEYLRNINVDPKDDQERTRDILDGGEKGLRALLGRAPTRGDISVPAANLMLSGITRAAQQLGVAPDLKIDPPTSTESERGKKASEKRERLVSCYDDISVLDMMLPQVARWLIGYGFVPVIIREEATSDGWPYPFAELRDPFECFPSEWGPQQQPRDLAFIRRVPRKEIARLYPSAVGKLFARPPGGGPVWEDETARSATGTWSQPEGWENRSGTGVEIAEYHCESGMYVVSPDRKILLDYQPNPLSSGPAFHVFKRFSFNQLQGQFHHVVGLLAMMAKMNVLAQIAMEDAVFAETNVYGGDQGQPYRRGRNAVNYFEQGTQVDRPVQNLPYQLFEHIDRIERQLRDTAGYSIQDDGRSPNSYVTGRGLQELNTSGTAEMAEYQVVMRYGLQALDSKRLEWDECEYADLRKPMAGYRKGASFSEDYTPSAAINGNYRTQRIYGAMAGFDEPAKIVAILQLLQGNLVSAEWGMQQLSGIDSVTREKARIVAEAAERTVMQGLLASAANPEAPDHQRAVMAAVEMLPASKLRDALEKYYTEDGEEMSPEEEALAGVLGGPQEAGPQLPAAPPDLATVLSQLGGGGEVTGGVRTVGQLPAGIGEGMV